MATQMLANVPLRHSSTQPDRLLMAEYLSSCVPVMSSMNGPSTVCAKSAKHSSDDVETGMLTGLGANGSEPPDQVNAKERSAGQARHGVLVRPAGPYVPPVHAAQSRNGEAAP